IADQRGHAKFNLATRINAENICVNQRINQRKSAIFKHCLKMMETVKKGQLAKMLAEKMGVTNKQGAEWLDAFVEMVTNALSKGDKVNITGFGIFKVADRKAREGRNPRTGETIQIKASKKPRFTAGKLLKEVFACSSDIPRFISIRKPRRNGG